MTRGRDPPGVAVELVVLGERDPGVAAGLEIAQKGPNHLVVDAPASVVLLEREDDGDDRETSRGSQIESVTGQSPKLR